MRALLLCFKMCAHKFLNTKHRRTKSSLRLDSRVSCLDSKTRASSVERIANSRAPAYFQTILESLALWLPRPRPSRAARALLEPARAAGPAEPRRAARPLGTAVKICTNTDLPRTNYSVHTQHEPARTQVCHTTRATNNSAPESQRVVGPTHTMAVRARMKRGFVDRRLQPPSPRRASRRHVASFAAASIYW